MVRANSYNEHDAFWSKVTPEPNTGCWIWIGALSGGGYGSFVMNGKNWKAHRYSLFLEKGRISSDLDVLHSCDNTWCVNPGHLREGTAKDNMEDMYKKGRGYDRRGAANSRAKLNGSQVEIIRSSKLSTRLLSKIYDVSPSTIRRAFTAKTWSA